MFWACKVLWNIWCDIGKQINSITLDPLSLCLSTSLSPVISLPVFAEVGPSLKCLRRSSHSWSADAQHEVRARRSRWAVCNDRITSISLSGLVWLLRRNNSVYKLKDTFIWSGGFSSLWHWRKRVSFLKQDVLTSHHYQANVCVSLSNIFLFRFLIIWFDLKVFNVPLSISVNTDVQKTLKYVKCID